LPILVMPTKSAPTSPPSKNSSTNLLPPPSQSTV
jgi:hypothetical protein